MSSGIAFGTLGDPPGPLKTYVFLKEFNDFHHCGNPDFSLVSASHPRRPRGPRGLREPPFSAPGPLPLDTFTRLFSEYAVLLTRSFLAARHAGPRGRRIREACGHFRRLIENEIPHSESYRAANGTRAIHCIVNALLLEFGLKRSASCVCSSSKTLRVLSSIGNCK